MTDTANSVKAFLTDFLTPILPNIVGELTRESLINIHRLISGNIESVMLNLGGGWNGHLVLTITAEDYLAQTCHSFVPPHRLGYHPLIMVTAQY